MNFWDFLSKNSLSNLATLFLLGVAFGAFGFKFFKKIFWLAIILALILALSKSASLKARWPFSLVNKDSLSKFLNEQAKENSSPLLKEDLLK